MQRYFSSSYNQTDSRFLQCVHYIDTLSKLTFQWGIFRQYFFKGGILQIFEVYRSFSGNEVGRKYGYAIYGFIVSFFFPLLYCLKMTVFTELFGKFLSTKDFEDLDSRRIKRLLNILLAEILGTGILILIGCGTVIGFTMNDEAKNYLAVCFAFGFGTGTAIMVFGEISGCFINPAVSLAAVICGKLSVYMGALYIISELVGAAIAHLLLVSMSSLENINANNSEMAMALCCNSPNEQLSTLQALTVEIVGTMILIFAVCSIWDFRFVSKTETASLKFSVVISSLALSFAGYSSCGLNPARSFGPALITGYWDYHWIYWIGPLTGSAMSSLFYAFFFKTSYTLPEQKLEIELRERTIQVFDSLYQDDDRS